MADTCRCHLPFDPPTGPHWWPSRDAEPPTSVRAVALAGQQPAFLRAERRGGAWFSAGLGAAHPDSPQPKAWGEVGLCWDGTEHAVVDVVAAAAGALPSSTMRAVDEALRIVLGL